MKKIAGEILSILRGRREVTIENPKTPLSIFFNDQKIGEIESGEYEQIKKEAKKSVRCFVLQSLNIISCLLKMAIDVFKYIPFCFFWIVAFISLFSEKQDLVKALEIILHGDVAQTVSGIVLMYKSYLIMSLVLSFATFGIMLFFQTKEYGFTDIYEKYIKQKVCQIKNLYKYRYRWEKVHILFWRMENESPDC